MRSLILVLSLFAASVLPACNGGVHRKGERMAIVRVIGSPWPLHGHAIAWEGESDDEYVGAGIGNYWFIRDRAAIGVLLSGANYQYSGENILAVELEFAYRWYVLEHEEYAYFWDAGFGAQWAESEVPKTATQYEYTFSFGPGMEIPILENSKIMVGFQFHHQSNALGRQSDENPSQNEFRLWAAWGWMW